MLNRIFIFFFLLFSAVYVTGCAGGGPVLGMPISGPKNLKGKVENSEYIAPNRSFKVALPYREKSPEWKYMRVREGTDGDKLTHIDFGPIYGPSIGPPVFDDNYYSVTYLEHSKDWDSSMFYEWVPKVLKAQLGSINSNNKYTIKQLSQEKTIVNEKQAVYSVFELSPKKGPTEYFVICLIEYGGHAANIMATVGPYHSRTNKEELLTRKWTRFNNLLYSFKPL